MSAIIKAFEGYVPQLAEGVFIADGAVVVGQVDLGAHVNVWYGAVIRGDSGPIRVGECSTIQDLACLHMKKGGPVVEIGRYVSVGHGVIVHGATIDDGAFIGNGATIMDGAHIGEQTIVAAGSLVARATVVPAGCFVRGRPAKVVRDLTPEELASGKREAERQLELARASD